MYIGYRFGFNGQHKDNEIKGIGNSLDFGARMYDSRLGRWLSTDKIMKAYLSTYQFGKNNPIINIDPDGNTEYYFQGRWVGSDGANNNLIGIVKSKDISKQMKKGEYKYPLELKNGTDGTDAFIVDANVLDASDKVLDLAMSKDGANKEYGTRMNKNANGDYVSNGIVEGPAVNPEEGTGGSVDIEGKGGTPIHSHPKVSGVRKDGKGVGFYSADRPGPGDDVADDEDMAIIVGKNGEPGVSAGPSLKGTGTSLTIDDNRKPFINFFKGGSKKPALSLPRSQVKEILKDYKTRGK